MGCALASALETGEYLAVEPTLANERDLTHLLLRPTQPVAARHKREHQRSPASVLSQGTDLSRHSRDEIETVALALKQSAAKDARVEKHLRRPFEIT